MPRRSKGPRLYLRSPRPGREALWVIRDGSVEVSTGCTEDRLGGPEGAEQKLADYIARKWTPDAPRVRTGDPATILIDEVLTFYVKEKAPTLADPVATGVRVDALSEWWGERTLADVKMSTCRSYVAHRIKQPLKQAKRGAALDKRVTAGGARRELEDLSAAITFWAKEYPLNPRPVVTLPAKAESPRDALTRSQAAALLKAAMGWRRQADGTWRRLKGSSRSNRAHVRRFILIGLYTGTRPGVIPKLLWHESASQAWVDLPGETIYRRGRGEVEHRTKRRPLVRMPKRLAAHMRRWDRLDQAAHARAAGLAEKQGHEPPAPIISVVHHGGEPVTGRIRRAFASCVADAGLPLEITPHWMRHTCATWLMEKDVKPWDAAAYTGMTTATLEKCYGHHRPGYQGSARGALGGK